MVWQVLRADGAPQSQRAPANGRRKPQRDTDGRRGPRPIGREAKYEARPALRRHGCRAVSTWRAASMALRRAAASVPCALRRRGQGSAPRTRAAFPAAGNGRRRAGSIPQMDDVAPHDAAYAARQFLPGCRSPCNRLASCPPTTTASRRTGAAACARACAPTVTKRRPARRPQRCPDATRPGASGRTISSPRVPDDACNAGCRALYSGSAAARRIVARVDRPLPWATRHCLCFKREGRVIQ